MSMVEWKKLGDIFEIKKGRSLSKDDIGSGDFPVILYGELYTTYDDYITTIYSSVSTEIAAEATPLKYNDLVLPVSSTTKEAQIGKVSVIKCKEAVSLGGDALIFRSNLNADYLMYYLNSQLFEKEKMQCVNGTTIMHLSPKKIADKLVPLPSPEEQSRIVGILDTFTASIANLKEQIGERRKQYNHYRDQLLELEGKEGVEMKMLGEVVELARGVRVVKTDLAMEGMIPVFQNSLSPLGYYDIHNYPAGTTFVISAGAAGDIGFSDVPFWAADDCLGVTCKNDVLNKFVFYFLQTKQTTLKSQVRKASVPRLSRIVVEKLSFPCIPISEQARIVNILDQFEASIANLEAQLQEREKQYEHYRNQLLTF